jgi:hypothetical protein
MKRRASGTIRVVTRCARCGNKPDLYDVDHLRLTLGGRPHELIVCRGCTKLLAGEATSLERVAMGCDPGNPIDDADFTETFHLDAARVRRTAEHFLGAEAYAWLVPECRAAYEETRERRLTADGWPRDDSDEDDDEFDREWDDD